MSHVTTIEVDITDFDQLAAACAMLGLEFVRNQKTYRWYGRWVNDFNEEVAAASSGFDPETFGQCEHAIKVPGSEYEIGVVKKPTGNGYTLLFDAWGKNGKAISNLLGGRCEKLVQRYAANVAKKQLQRKGMKFVERVLSNGTIRLETI